MASFNVNHSRTLPVCVYNVTEGSLDHIFELSVLFSNEDIKLVFSINIVSDSFQ